jgi:Flp pilus assembly protein TadG
MKAKTKKTERGQALVLMALALIGLLGFTALAIDGGLVYADRRRAQNGSDASSLAGGAAAALSLENSYVTYAQWNCSDSRILAAEQAAKTAAISRAGDNDYSIDLDTSDHNAVTTNCGQEDHGFWIDKFIDITTLISSPTQTSFVHFVFSGPLINNVEAVTRVRPSQPLVLGHAIVALNDAGCSGHSNGANFHGNAETIVHGGGVYTNGCLRANGGPVIIVHDGPINYVGETDGNMGAFSPAPQQVPPVVEPDDYFVPPPDCSHPDAHNVANLDSDLDPGLYCLSGDLRINGGDTVVGDGVTIYVPNGEIWINGNATVQLSAPGPGSDPAIEGILFYLPPSNHNPVQLNGTSDSYFQGVVLAPGSDVNVLGTGDVTAYRSQIIGWNVEVGGTADAGVVYNDNDNYDKPASLELYK